MRLSETAERSRTMGESGDVNGAYMFRYRGRMGQTYTLRVIASDGEGWEHVSVSLSNRTPTWEEMCFIKQQFWPDDECVMQLHPPKQDYVNEHPHCLHLWKPLETSIPRPPYWLVGLKVTN